MEIETFCYDQVNEYEVRTYIDENGNVWFCAKDVCNILGLQNNRQAITSLESDDKLQYKIEKGTPCHHYILPPLSYNLTFVSECGLYQLIFKSEKEEAKKFKKWVCKEVIPQIRKTGKYESQALVDTNPYPVTNEDLKWIVNSEMVKESSLTLHHLALDLLVQRIQGNTTTEKIRIKDISQHMIDLQIDQKYITKYRCQIGRYVKNQYIEKYKTEPPTSDKNVKWNGKLVEVDDYHGGANRAVCWYPPDMYDEVKGWILEFFRIKHPELQINPSPLIAV